MSAFRFHALGNTLDNIHMIFKLEGIQVSRQTIWRAVREVTTAKERIESARRTGNYDVLSVGEAVIALEQEPNQSSLKGATDEPGK
jgi:transposase-like protein